MVGKDMHYSTKIFSEKLLQDQQDMGYGRKIPFSEF